MASPGFKDLPSTQHFKFEYDQSLNDADEITLGKALANTAEGDFNILSSWFGGAAPTEVLPFDVRIKAGHLGGGSNTGGPEIDLNVGTSPVVNYARSVLVAEAIEIFMVHTPTGWKPGNSDGEGLSQAAQFTMYPDQARLLDGPVQWLDSSINPTPGNPSRQDFVTNPDPSDKLFKSFGCALLFLYYLHSQLGFEWPAIVAAHRDNNSLEEVYNRLTQGWGAYKTFAAILENKFPSGTACGLNGSTNPFPLPSNAWLSARQFLREHQVNPARLGRLVRDNRRFGNLRALLNTDRPASLVQ